METQNAEFKIWGADNAIYGPTDVGTLAAWIKDERVTKDTWIYDIRRDAWRKAGLMPELAPSFSNETEIVAAPSSALIRPGMMRRVKVLADMTAEQLNQFAEYMEPVQVRQFTHLVRQGSPGGDMFLLLEGEMRVRLMIGDKETIIASLAAGEVFGEIALFDDGPRSADVLANSNCLLLKVSREAFDKIRRQAPELAAAFLLALGKTMAARIRSGNKRLKDAVAQARFGGY